MDKYSVLMSLYIKEKPEYLKRSIDSMINQTVTPDEIVIVKDGLITNELEAVLREYKKKYSDLFSIVTSEENLGLGLALNLGLKYCKNELVVRMDTDDISLPNRCEKQLRRFSEDNELSIVGGWISEFIGDENCIVGKRIVPLTNDDIKTYLTKRCPFNHMTVMFKKSIVLKAGNYEDWFWNEDYYLWIRMFELGCKFSNIGETLVNVRVGPDMYKRRGGIKYFISEAKIQKYMLDRKIIHVGRYLYNTGLRFIIQVLMPNNVRGFIFQKFARNVA